MVNWYDYVLLRSDKGSNEIGWVISGNDNPLNEYLT